MLMSVRYRWTGDVDKNRLWVRELYTYVNYIQKCTKRTVNVRARLHSFESFDSSLSAILISVSTL